MSIISDAIRKKMLMNRALQSIPDESAVDFAELYPKWSAGVELAEGIKLTHEGTLYKVINAHTTQSDWAPGPETASLFAEILTSETGEPIQWTQPESTNPYMAGDRVIHNEHVWESLIDNNVWEPGAVGTESLWAVVDN